jgi:hypothetical protein
MRYWKPALEFGRFYQRGPLKMDDQAEDPVPS